jgi:hypothetical protein
MASITVFAARKSGMTLVSTSWVTAPLSMTAISLMVSVKWFFPSSSMDWYA